MVSTDSRAVSHNTNETTTVVYNRFIIIVFGCLALGRSRIGNVSVIIIIILSVGTSSIGRQHDDNDDD
jgi:hypothetical protein